MLNRRNILMTGAAAVALGGLPAGRAAMQGPAKDGVTSADLNRLFDDFVSEQLNEIPELTTALGLDVGARAHERSELTHRSLAEATKLKALIVDQLRRLKAFDRASLDAKDTVSYDVVLYG